MRDPDALSLQIHAQTVSNGAAWKSSTSLAAAESVESRTCRSGTMALEVQGLAKRPSRGLFGMFLVCSALLHGLLLAGNPHWFPEKPLQVIDLDLFPLVPSQPPSKGEELKPLEPAPSLAMPDVKPQPREEPKPPEPLPEPKPVQRAEVQKKVKKPKSKPVPPRTIPSEARSPAPAINEAPFAGSAPIASLGRPDAPPGPAVTQGSEDAVKHFLAQVRHRIDRYKHYPYVARRRHIEGRVTVRFVIRPDGTVENLEVVKRSSSNLLDEAAVKAVKDASPFPGFPREILSRPLAVEIGLVFELI